ncbi:L,D-transpeptidase family protein [Herbaspirillum sp. RTI4]|nr:L,D-transpeptidase family protein [Herbaspirillum sp. RTI4]MDY7578628.1 L,D-transpeptidase family protein [Herbaspirillum sp. RTI4]MEA9981066.1 L,D-transpeptidase family protein [Herbaspirillum sp. RTI4]
MLNGEAASPAPQPSMQATIQQNPETLLRSIYKDMAADRLSSAQAKADALVQAYPNFRLGHLVRGDLLMMHARPVNTLGAVADAPPEKLKDLRAEAIVRLKSQQHRPDPQMIPKSMLQIGDDQKNVLFVDTKRSRLYVYENHGGELKLLSDFYISQGKLGVNKTKEGDQRTPIGVYYVNGRIPGPKLPEFYGPGALPLSYPNEWDKRNGRSGSGIWLHGTPSNNYSRPPLSSDGCVVLTNPDLQSLYALTAMGKTAVVISEHVEFIDKEDWAREKASANKLLNGWQQALEAPSTEKLLGSYSANFRSNIGENLSAWFARQQKMLNGARIQSVKLHDISQFLYPGRDDMIVSTFTQESWVGKSKSITRKRQYWVKEGAEWKIVYEGIA